ncbi:MAG: tolB protein [Solirubrobacteraceae bacterium]|nr:tolB protein [Solirubrobacteraceae bacterium]
MKRAALAVATLATALAAAPAAHATLAYVKGARAGKPMIWVAADNGRQAHVLIAGGQNPRVSPDGTQVAFVSGTRNALLRVVPAAGGKARTLAQHVWNYDAIQWSADSTELSVTTGPELGPYTLKLVTVATGRSVSLKKGGFYGVSFSPTGAGVAFSRATKETFPVRANLYTASLAGTSIKKLTDDDNATSPVWGPDRIAFDRARPPAKRGDYDKLEIYSVKPDGTGVLRMTHTAPHFLLAGLSPLAWSADGSRLAAEYGGQDTSEAWRVNPKTGSAADATGKFDGVVGWGLSRDGRFLLTTTGYFDSPDGDVVAIAWDGGAQTVLARKATQPSWSR